MPRRAALVTVALAALAAAAGARVLNVGVLVTDTGQFASIGVESRVAITMWEEAVAER